MKCRRGFGMNTFEYTSALQYRVKAQARQIDEFKSGEGYRKIEETYKGIIRDQEKTIRRLKQELAQAHQETISVREKWMETVDDLDREYNKELRRKDRQIATLKKENLEMARQRDEALDKCHGKQQEIYRIGTLLEEAEGLNKKLTAQVNMDFENSSIPSSQQKPGKKRIPNSRVRTGRKPGGQPGHAGHRRRHHPVTQTHKIPAPEKYLDTERYYKTGKTIRKQKVAVRMSVDVIEYTADEYRDRRTGARVHAAFPQGYVNEVNYDGTVKAFAFLLSNECNVSHGKIRKLLSELTQGEVVLSDGMINGLAREFSEKTKPEKKEIIEKLMRSPVMNVDFTNASVNGQSAQVLVLASPTADVALYIGREHKGHKGIEGTPLEAYVGTIVHDHDTTFYRYGTRHQECIQHDCRYLIGSEQNEPELEWNKQMHGLLREMLHYRNGLGEKELDASIVAGFEKRYDEILDKAEEEYTDDPPSDYYREGYNLFLRLRKYKEQELLFLHDKRVPANNSLCERLARVYKRKQKQVITLHSQDNLCYICDGLSIVYLLRSKNADVYREISEMYRRKRPPKPKKEQVAAKA